jgi:hypothetical protein
VYEIENYFRFDKDIVKDELWADLEPAAKTVYPVIAIHANAKGNCWPHIKTIKKLSGRKSNKTVHVGIADLKLRRLIKVRKLPIKRGFRKNHYHVPSIAPLERGRWFPFHSELIRLRSGEKDIWSKLKSSEQALYIAMRTFTIFNSELYCQHRPIQEGLSVADFDEWFPLREFEWCQMSNNKLADYAGVSRQRIPLTLAGLQKHGLIEPDSFGWIVYFRRRMPDP